MFETKFALLALRLQLATLQQGIEYRLEQLPRPVLVGVTQRGALRRLFNAQMAQFPFTGGQPAGDLAQTLRVPQLAKQHRDHLRPAGETARMPLGLVLLYGRFKLRSRDQL